MKTLSKAVAVASLLTAGVMSSQVAMAEAEVSASGAVSNMYLWRGTDLGGSTGQAAMSGDLSVSMSGAYAGVWASSGDATNGNEYDLYVGYGLETGGVEVDASIWTYVYPDAGVSDTMGDLTELIVSVSAAGASFAIYEPLTGNSSDYSYMTLGYGMDKYSVTLGLSSSDSAASDYTHVDLGYAYNDNLSFTLSQVVDQDTDNTVDNDAKVAVTFSLPIE